VNTHLTILSMGRTRPIAVVILPGVLPSFHSSLVGRYRRVLEYLRVRDLIDCPLSCLVENFRFLIVKGLVDLGNTCAKKWSIFSGSS